MEGVINPVFCEKCGKLMTIVQLSNHKCNVSKIEKLAKELSVTVMVDGYQDWEKLAKFVQTKCIESELKGMKYVYHNPARNKYFERITELKAELSGVEMKAIEEILKQFDEKFGYIDHNQDVKTTDSLDVPTEEVKSFIRTALQEQENQWLKAKDKRAEILRGALEEIYYRPTDIKRAVEIAKKALKESE